MSDSGTADQSPWRVYRARRRDVWIAFPLGLLLFVFGSIAADRAGLRDTEIRFALFAAWGLTYLFTSIRLAAFRCPGCGKPFAKSRFRRVSLFAKECVHCGLHLGDPPPS